jgi:hypothetical protein
MEANVPVEKAHSPISIAAWNKTLELESARVVRAIFCAIVCPLSIRADEDKCYGQCREGLGWAQTQFNISTDRSSTGVRYLYLPMLMNRPTCCAVRQRLIVEFLELPLIRHVLIVMISCNDPSVWFLTSRPIDHGDYHIASSPPAASRSEL